MWCFCEISFPAYILYWNELIIRLFSDSLSSSEFIVDEECILQLFKSCRQCNRHCTVRKQVKGLQLVINQKCGFCESRWRWTNLPDEDEGDLQINWKKMQHMNRWTQQRLLDLGNESGVCSGFIKPMIQRTGQLDLWLLSYLWVLLFFSEAVNLN